MFARLLKIFLPVAFGVIAIQTFPANALGGSTSVVIAQVQAGSGSGDGAATQEFISIYNNSLAPVDITNWCLSNKAGVSFACIGASDANTTLSLPAHAYALLASDTFAGRYAGSYDATFITTNKTSGSLVGGSDTVSLLDANGTTIDSIAWTTSLAGGSVLTRSWSNQATGSMLDTDSSSDFKKLAILVVPPSGVVEEIHVTDVCPNIDGIQQTIPAGFGIVGSDCILDVCLNLSGLQSTVPVQMRLDAAGLCVYALPLLTITELLPNASGSDDGNEFIELFNPTAEAVNLSLYRLQIGPNFEKTYAFPAGSSVEPKGYKAFFNDSISFTLLNTSSRARLISVDGQIISEAPSYTNPGDDAAWAFLSDAWLFTNQPTPGLENLLPTEDGTTADTAVTVVSGLKPCASNQYRNPETNRCRALVVADTELKACKDGQYRSEETNRCRSIASDASTAKACAENQFRNPDTGRCKKIASEDEIKDCGEGRERNPETKRCRNVVTVASGTTSGGVSLMPASAASVLGWWAGGIVGFIALGYAGLEWRKEIGGWIARTLGPAVRAVRRVLPW